MWDDHEIREGYGTEESDFKECNIAIKQIASQPRIKYLIMGNRVPFIFILDFVESIAAESAIAGLSFLFLHRSFHETAH